MRLKTPSPPPAPESVTEILHQIGRAVIEAGKALERLADAAPRFVPPPEPSAPERPPEPPPRPRGEYINTKGDLDSLVPEGVRRLEEGGLTFLLFERPAETPPSEILDSAKRLVTIFNGAAFVFGVDSERIEADGVTRLEHDGRRSIFVVLTGAAAGRARASATLTVTNADGSERPPARFQ